MGVNFTNHPISPTAVYARGFCRRRDSIHATAQDITHINKRSKVATDARFKELSKEEVKGELVTHPGWQSLILHLSWPEATSRANTSPPPVPNTNIEVPSFLFFCKQQELSLFSNRNNKFTNYSLQHKAIQKQTPKSIYLSLQRQPFHAGIINREMTFPTAGIYVSLFCRCNISKLCLDLALNCIPNLYKTRKKINKF